ncbi:hypothetical protein H312_01625 [Anncaliia algerae PRA339]|uniref:Uncharacterized protein n=1 Tax=Anncaliia algerae PRA339 TaxID=1288291 RepID=A0A059F1C6_9MICR|nr:hypothetical protein H312_01625 [Anncaliia algerae PRA339]
MMKVKLKPSSINLRVSKCIKNKCGNTRLITSGSKLHFINTSVDKFIKIIYTYVLNFNNYQAFNFCQVNETKLLKFRDFIKKSFHRRYKITLLWIRSTA